MSIQFSYYRNIHASHMILTPALEGEPWEKEMPLEKQTQGTYIAGV